jgi:hypothetical protein
LPRERGLAGILLQLARLLDRLGQKEEALRFGARGDWLERLTLNATNEAWAAAAWEKGLADRPVWVVELSPENQSFTFSVDGPDWWRFAFLDRFSVPNAYYRLGFAAPPGRYFLKATVTAASDWDRSRPLRLPRFERLTEPATEEDGASMLARWVQLGLPETEKERFELWMQWQPGQEEALAQRQRELDERSRRADHQTFLFQPGVRAFAVQQPAFGRIDKLGEACGEQGRDGRPRPPPAGGKSTEEPRRLAPGIARPGGGEGLKVPRYQAGGKTGSNQFALSASPPVGDFFPRRGGQDLPPWPVRGPWSGEEDRNKSADCLRGLVIQASRF